MIPSEETKAGHISQRREIQSADPKQQCCGMEEAVMVIKKTVVLAKVDDRAVMRKEVG